MNGENSVEAQVKRIEKEKEDRKKESARLKREAKAKLKSLTESDENNAEEIDSQCCILTIFPLKMKYDNLLVSPFLELNLYILQNPSQQF